MIAAFEINLRFTISTLEKKDWSRATIYICPICGGVWFTVRSKLKRGSVQGCKCLHKKSTDSPFTLVLICYNTIYNFNFVMSLGEKHKILYHILQFLILKLTSRFGRGSTVAACSSHSGQVASSRCKLQAISEILLHQPSFL